MTEKLRQVYIHNIIQTKSDNNDLEYNQKNKIFLETLTLNELENLSNEVILEEEL